MRGLLFLCPDRPNSRPPSHPTAHPVVDRAQSLHMDSASPVFVTGGTGLVGSFVLRYLLHRGYTQVRALRRATSTLDLVSDIRERIDWVEGDLLDVDALEAGMEGATTVYHCAASIDHRPRGRAVMRRTNVTGTATVVNAALHCSVSQLCHVSSTAALGRRPGLTQIDERTEWKADDWNSAYAVSKYDAELEVRRGEAEGLRVLIVNPSLVMGPGRWDRGMPRWLSNVDRGLRFYPTGGGGLVDVRDVATFMVRAVEASYFGERYVLNATNLPYRTVFDEIADLLDRPRPKTPVTPLLQALAWRWEALRARLSAGHEPLVTRETASNSARTFHYDGTAATRLPGFAYRDWRNSLRDLVACFPDGYAGGPNCPYAFN